MKTLPRTIRVVAQDVARSIHQKDVDVNGRMQRLGGGAPAEGRSAGRAVIAERDAGMAGMTAESWQCGRRLWWRA